MLLPNGDQAVVEDAKLLDYCLSTTHPRGRHKARLFAAALGMTAQHAGELKAALLTAARSVDATPTHASAFGQFYEIRFPLSGPSRTANMLSVWIVADTASPPRLVTCYPL